MEKVELRTADIAAENAAKLAELFPDIVTEVMDEGGSVRHSIDVEALKAHVGDIAEDKRERYQFTWPGKQKARTEAIRPIDKTMRPCPEESVNWDTTENLYIEGDNLDALKILRETYAGKIKMIYIDPPYNTGHDFVYNDDFAHTAEEERAESGAFDEEGNVLDAAYKVNNESNGKFHSDWCSMMYPRLVLARDLLSEDGVVFISIDDNESKNLKALCDEVFGSGSFLNQIAWINNITGRQISGIGAAKTWESVFIYCKSADCAPLLRIKADFAKQVMRDSYKGFDKEVFEDDRGLFTVGDTLYNHNRMFNEETRPNLVFSIFYNPDTEEIATGNIGEAKSGYIELPPHSNGDGIHKYHAWRWSKKKIAEESYDLIVKKTPTGKYEIYTRIRSYDSTLFKDVITNISNGASELTKLMGGKYFNYPKSVDLLKVLLGGYGPQSIILDFFSGSATTAHAVMQLNAEDGGNRKFIMVQLPEVCDEKSEAAKAGYKNICEIGKERIRRAGAKIAAEVEESNAQFKLGEEPKRVPDIGFRVLKIDSSNFEDVARTPDTLFQDALFSLADNVKPGRTPEDILFQLFPKLEIPYTARIDTFDICGKTVYSVDDDTLVACFDREVPEDVVRAMAEREPAWAVLRDASFTGDDALANFEEIFKTVSPETKTRVV